VTYGLGPLPGDGSFWRNSSRIFDLTYGTDAANMLFHVVSGIAAIGP
jgi:hypothetical protein